MNQFQGSDLRKLYKPPPSSHKGQNGKLMIIGGSKLFHAASLWSLKVASRIVDMVFYSSVPENNELVKKAKREFRDGIVVPRNKINDYINEADCVLIGPGMLRAEREEVLSIKYKVLSIEDINKIGHEGVQSYYLTKYLLQKYPNKKWVIDAGALQMMEAEWLKKLIQTPILTPHGKEFETLFPDVILNSVKNLGDPSPAKRGQDDIVSRMAKKYNCIIILKGQTDIVCPPSPPLGEAGSPKECVEVAGGNPGMTKGGTGDVLAGLVAALYCKNDAFLSATSASYINKKAGESLYKKVGLYFNASDLADEIPRVMKELILT